MNLLADLIVAKTFSFIAKTIEIVLFDLSSPSFMTMNFHFFNAYSLLSYFLQNYFCILKNGAPWQTLFRSLQIATQYMTNLKTSSTARGEGAVVSPLIPP